MIVGPVAKGHNRNSKSAVSVQLISKIRQDFIWELPRIGGSTYDSHIIFCKAASGIFICFAMVSASKLTTRAVLPVALK